MSNLILGILASVVFVGVALAADLPRKEPLPPVAAPIGKPPIGKAPLGKFPLEARGRWSATDTDGIPLRDVTRPLSRNRGRVPFADFR
jgi:hypothetical protein